MPVDVHIPGIRVAARVHEVVETFFMDIEAALERHRRIIRREAYLDFVEWLVCLYKRLVWKVEAVAFLSGGCHAKSLREGGVRKVNRLRESGAKTINCIGFDGATTPV